MIDNEYTCIQRIYNETSHESYVQYVVIKLCSNVKFEGKITMKR